MLVVEGAIVKRWTVALLTGLLALCAGMGCGAEEEATPTATALSASPTAASEGPFISIDAPSEGNTVTIPVRVEGRARVFEGTVLVMVKDAGGEVVCEMLAQATKAAPGVGTWAVDLAFPPPASGPADATIEAYSESPRDGSVENLQSVSVSVSSDLPPIVLTQPGCGDRVPGILHVEGTASVPDGELIVVVRGFAGAQDLARETIRATEGAPGRGSFSADLTLPPIWSATMRTTVEAYSLNPDDGSVENVFAVPIVLPAP
jgi:hypothetical protein